MVSTFTPNLGFEEPARNDLVGVWDTPWNSNSTLLDLVTGGITTIPLNNSNVVLSGTQFQSKTIVFNSTLTGNVTITFPSTFIKSYEIQNLCTGTSAFTILMTTPTANSLFVAAPPGEAVNITNDGAGNLRYRNFGHIGEYWDYAGSSVPNWVSTCGTNNVGFVPQPYLNCDGSTFSATFYPVLAQVLGTTTLPDSRGRSRTTLNGGTGRITAGISGVDGNTRSAAGGNESMQQHLHGVSDPTHTHGHNALLNNGTFLSATGAGGIDVTAAATINAAFTGISVNLSGAGGSQNMPPAYVGGLTMIRAG